MNYFRIAFVPEGHQRPRTLWATEVTTPFVARRGVRCFQECQIDGEPGKALVFVSPTSAAVVVPAQMVGGLLQVPRSA